MEKIIEFSNRVTANFKQRDKEKMVDFLPTIEMANPESLDVLEKYNVALTKNSQIIVLTQDPKTLMQTLELSEKMGFIDAYRENPKRLKLLVPDVIKRMAKCDALGIPYKNERGYANFLFSSRLFKQMTDTLTEEQKKVIASPTEDTNKEYSLDDIKGYANEIIAQYDFTEDAINLVHAKIDELKESDLGAREILMEAFKTCAANPELLGEAIDDVMNNGVGLGRKAA